MIKETSCPHGRPPDWLSLQVSFSPKSAQRQQVAVRRHVCLVTGSAVLLRQVLSRKENEEEGENVGE